MFCEAHYTLSDSAVTVSRRRRSTSCQPCDVLEVACASRADSSPSGVGKIHLIPGYFTRALRGERTPAANMPNPAPATTHAGLSITGKKSSALEYRQAGSSDSAQHKTSSPTAYSAHKNRPESSGTNQIARGNSSRSAHRAISPPLVSLFLIKSPAARRRAWLTRSTHSEAQRVEADRRHAARIYR